MLREYAQRRQPDLFRQMWRTPDEINRLFGGLRMAPRIEFPAVNVWASADGAMVPLTGGQWAEVRTLAIGEVPAGSPDAEKVHVGHLSSFSRMTDAAHFTDLAEVETRRRHVVQAKEVCALMDGAGLTRRIESAYRWAWQSRSPV